MVTLTVAAGGEQRTFPITGTVTIGRAIDNDIQLDSVSVSRHHASIVASPAGLMLMDLGSANGSRINGKDVEPRVPVAIRPGDRIMLADVEIGLQEGAGGPIATAAGGTPGMTRVGGMPAGPTGPHATVFAAVVPRLEIVTREGTREVPLTGERVTIGRETDNEIQVNADVVSRHHLVLRRSNGTYVAEDLGTTNGIRFQGERVQSRSLMDGDVLDIAGEVSLRYAVAPSPAVTTEEQQQEVRIDPNKTITIGRGEGCDLRLTHPTVSLLHARVTPMPGGRRVVEDLGSTNGTYVNGIRLAKGEQRMLAPADVIQVGPIRLHLSEAGVRSEDHSAHIRLTAVRLNQRVSKSLNLLQDISVVVEPQEFVAVVGVSGSGKSTLLGALSGLRPASDGDVLLNETSLYDHFDAFRTTLGYVPQDDILHRELPVGRALDYAAELRLPDDTSDQERHGRVESVVATLGLQERRDTPVGRLSGGQRKRVSIGAEMLTQPGLFFLDEATSGLDPGTESQLMRLLRKLADDGHTILLITHATKNVMLCDQVLFLAKGGNLAYYGPPEQALGYFEVEDFDGIYEKLEAEKSPEEWAAKYRASAQYQEFVAGRLAAQGALAPETAAAPARRAGPPEGRTSSAWHQFRVLSLRYLDLIRRDRVNFALLFLLAPALSLVDLIAWPRDVLSPTSGQGGKSMTMLFLAALIPFLVGSLSSVREIVKESAIYSRERAVSLKVWPYLGSKIAIGSLFAFYHAGVLLAAKMLLIDFPGATAPDFAAMYVTMVLAVISGVMWALLISTLTRREEQAMMLIIGIIVMQLVFSGGLMPISSLGPVGAVFAALDSTGWVFQALTAGAGLSAAGCAGDFATCNIPGVQGLATPAERAITFKSVDEAFGDVFDANILVCWAALVLLIIGMAFVLYFLQKRKDIL